MNKIREIIGAWITSFNPNEEEKKLAERRYEECIKCEYRKNNRLGVEICELCGCPLSKKIFTQKLNETCPLNKWDSAESMFRMEKREKNKYKLF